MSLDAWLAALETRHLANLTPSEVTRALRSLSSCYVERRDRLSTGAALDGAGKRAAFALFYGPQHFLVAREVVASLRTAGALTGITRVIDLGCGTGSAGSAVALECNGAIDGYDLNRWAVDEANWTYRFFGLNGRAQVSNIRTLRIDGGHGSLYFAGYAVNELPEPVRDELLARMLTAHTRGASLLVIEPIGRRANPWWTKWSEAFVSRGGRDDDWRFRIRLPPRQALLAKGAGLDVQELTARSLML